MNLKKVTLVLAYLAFSFPLLAATPKKTGEFDAWKTFQLKKSTYMVSKPKSCLKAGKKTTPSSDAHIMVNHANDKFTVSITASQNLKKGSTVVVKIDDQNFDLFADGKTAWCYDEKDDEALTQALLKGNALSIEGSNTKGESFQESYSLKGTSAAYKQITSA